MDAYQHRVDFAIFAFQEVIDQTLRYNFIPAFALVHGCDWLQVAGINVKTLYLGSRMRLPGIRWILALQTSLKDSLRIGSGAASNSGVRNFGLRVNLLEGV